MTTPTPQAIERAAQAILDEMSDRGLLNGVDEDLHDEIGRVLASRVLSDLGDMVLVPKEPTKKIIAAYIAADPRRKRFAATAKRDYRTMIAAAEGSE